MEEKNNEEIITKDVEVPKGTFTKLMQSTDSKKPSGPIQSHITLEEYEKIKEMDFRGETKEEIIRQSKRSWPTVTKVLESRNWAHYQDYSAWTKQTKPMSTALSKKPVAKLPDTVARYKRLQEFRNTLDEVLIEFIMSEVKANNEELVKENKDLIIENEKLRRQLEEQAEATENSSFVNALQEKLIKKDEPKVVTQYKIPKLYADSNGRFCFLIEDLKPLLGEDVVEKAKSVNTNYRLVKVNDKEVMPLTFVKKLMEHEENTK